MRLLAILCVLLLLPAAAAAQTNGGENPMGFALAFGSVGALALATPVLLVDHVPRPGARTWQVGLGYQDAPHSVALRSSAGAYWGEVPWLGLEGRTDGRIDASTAVDLHYDLGWYVLLRPTPEASPIWAEVLLGPTMESAFGLERDSYVTGGPSGGLRLGFGVPLSADVSLILEGEVLYNARFGAAFDGVRHQLEAAGHLALLHRLEEGGAIGVSLQYRREQAVIAEPTLPDTHTITLGAVVGL